MRLRELTIADATRVVEIEQALFVGDNPWSRDVFVAQFAQPYTFYVGAFVEDEADAEEVLVLSLIHI